MDIQTKERWLEGLRYGNYKKTRHILRAGDCVCAYGVLCDVIEPHSWTKLGKNWTWDNEKRTLAELVVDVGISPEQSLHIIEMNDEYNLSFEEIADWIEENL